MVVLIKGIKYKILLQSKKKYVKDHGPNSYAHTNKTEKLLVFREDHIKKNIVIHEVVHAYMNSLHLNSCNDLSLDDLEEIVCEMMEEHIQDIVRQSNSIFKYLRGK